MQVVQGTPLDPELLGRVDAYWRAANYLSVGQIYLMDNPLLREPLTIHQVKPRLLGHWGTTPGLNFIYVHLNRVIKAHDLDVIYLAGPGHGGPALVANTYLEGTYSEFSRDSNSYSSSFLFLVGSLVTSPQRRLGLFTKEENWGMC